jgi:hypothetical protein
MEQEQAASLDCWAIIDLFGHSKIAGKVKSESFGAACLIRVDVPKITRQATQQWDAKKERYVPGGKHVIEGFTRYIGVSAIYSLTPVTEELARKAAEQCAPEPVSAFGLESIKRLTAGEVEDKE